MCWGPIIEFEYFFVLRYIVCVEAISRIKKILGTVLYHLNRDNIKNAMLKMNKDLKYSRLVSHLIIFGYSLPGYEIGDYFE